MKTDHKFNPRDDNERMIVKALENGCRILCDVLNVDATLRVERMNGWGRADAFHCGKYIHDNYNGYQMTPDTIKMVKINMRNLYGASLEFILSVLGHEFRHAVQAQKKVMEIGLPDEILPPRSRYKNSYWNSDEEKDARKFQNTYRDIIINHEQFRYRNGLQDIVTGEPLKVPDYSASVAHLGVPKEFLQLFKGGKDAQGEIQFYWFDIREVNGNPKKWTNSVFRKVQTEHREQLMNQKFRQIYREVALEEMMY